MSYVCEPTFEAPETVVRLRARRHIRDAFASRQARGGDRRGAPRLGEKPTAAARDRRFDNASELTYSDSRLTEDDVFVAVASAAGAGGRRAERGVANVFAELIRETRSECGDGKAAALVCSLFLGSLSLKRKSQRVVPFTALANFAFARGHGDAAAETAARRFAFAVAAELVAALLRDCETSEEVWRAGVSVLSALGSNPEGDDEQEEKEEASASDRVRKEKENAARLRVAALDAAVAKRGAFVSRTDLVEGCVWFTVRAARDTSDDKS
mmetsp:Transcript_713/g.2914  ORF Transcript_713/g.2914 Transcript_713/m.2914 type:complete len:269 (-) Transcript_713:34-840(-)